MQVLSDGISATETCSCRETRLRLAYDSLEIIRKTCQRLVFTATTAMSRNFKIKNRDKLYSSRLLVVAGRVLSPENYLTPVR